MRGDNDPFEESQDRIGLRMEEVRKRQDEALQRTVSSAREERRTDTHLGETGSLGGREAGDERLEEVGEDRSKSGPGLADEVNDEVADEEASRLRARRFEETSHDCEDEFESRPTLVAAPKNETDQKLRHAQRTERLTSSVADQRPCAQRS